MTGSEPAIPSAPPPAGPPPAPAGVGPAAIAGHFTLLAELGSGSSGTVYRARMTEDYGDLPAGHEVAVKFLRQDRLADARESARLHAEGRLGQLVRHPNVAAIHGVETIEVLGLATTYLVMELVHGTTLRQYLNQQGPPVEDFARRIGAGAAAGLHALHRRGIVHRDVKPENLLLTTAGGLKIVDLGLAQPFGTRAAGEHGSPPSGHGVGGTLAYAAPEVLRGRPPIPRSDLYALGIVLYEVVTGRHPFAHCTTADDLIHAHLHEAPPRPSHLRPRISPLLDQLLLELLAKEPDERPRDAAEVARILQQGELSEWWRRHERRAPALASSRRLQRMRRPAETPFLGRADELRRMQRLLDLARGGAGRALVIAGPVGIGRRRLLDEAMTRWLERGDALLYLGGEADPGFGHAEPFASALLDWLLRGEGADAPHAEARAVARARVEFGLREADAAALIAAATGHSQEPPEVRGSRLANALLALPQPGRVLVLRVDQADRLDTSGRLVWQRLVQEAPSRPLLLLATAGVEWPPAPGLERLDLQGLGEPEFAAFGRALFRDGEEIAPLLPAAHATFSGSPGNLIEALEHLAQAERLAGRPGAYHGLLPGTELRPAPRHLQRFARRVERFPREQRHVLAAAAVLGQRCALADLVALAGGTEIEVLETLSLFRGRVVRAQGGEVVFRHPDFQKALLQGLPAAERRELHTAAAGLLAARGRSALEIGLQRSQALDHEGCVLPLLQGLDELVRSGSRRTSLRIAARLQVHLKQLPATPAHDRQRLQHLLLWARARRNAGQSLQALELCRQADALARALGDRLGVGEALTGLAESTFDAGRLLHAIALLENAHQELDAPAGDRARELAAAAHGLHGRILLYLGQPADGLRHVQAALRLLPPTGIDLQSHLQIDLARLEALQHDYPAATKALAKVDAAKAARHLPRVRLRLHLYRGKLRALLGDDEAQQDLRLSAAEAERLWLPAYGARAHLALGERAFQLGRDDEALAAFRTGSRLAELAGDRLGGTLAAIHRARLGDAVPLSDQTVEELGLPSLLAAWLLAQGVAARQRGDETAAAACAGRAVDLCEEAQVPLGLHLRALALAGREAAARSLVRAIADRFPDRRARKRFLRAWENGART